MISSFSLSLFPLNWLREIRNRLLFINHNSKFFSRSSSSFSASVILLEFNSLASSHVPYSYLANALRDLYSGRIVGYTPYFLSTKSKIRFHLSLLFPFGNAKIYRSFGVSSFITPSTSKAISSFAELTFRELLPNLTSKSDVENITISGIWIGDLIYDTFLNLYKRSTLDPFSPEFRSYLYKSILLFSYWLDYFNTNSVSAVCLSHTCYNLAFPLRIASSLGIPTYEANLTNIYHLSSDNLFSCFDSPKFPSIFNEFSSTTKSTALALAKERIDRRFKGEVGVDMPYMTHTAYGDITSTPILKKTSNKKILIASHCFFDSPHSYGNNLFPDFYEWIDFLGKLSLETPFDWYIKAHPGHTNQTMSVLEFFTTKYPSLTLIPSDSSHLQLISEGIDLALTCYGTIGFEYAALGVKVINASVNNPHIAYNFNFHPRSIEEYKNIILNFPHLPLQVDMNDIYQFYFMKNIFNTNNLFVSDYNSVVNILGGYKHQFTPDFYPIWISQFTPSSHTQILQGMTNYLCSADYRLSYTHFGKSFPL
jgi:hypothetical protein